MYFMKEHVGLPVNVRRLHRYLTTKAEEAGRRHFLFVLAQNRASSLLGRVHRRLSEILPAITRRRAIASPS
jgi:hypothetical protein